VFQNPQIFRKTLRLFPEQSTLETELGGVRKFHVIKKNSSKVTPNCKPDGLVA
jgi:hypothetical protein